jgi:hypothetical protein
LTTKMSTQYMEYSVGVNIGKTGDVEGSINVHSTNFTREILYVSDKIFLKGL